jgi:hypothetical protein
MARQSDRSDSTGIERRTLLEGVAGLGAVGLLGGATTGTAGAVVVNSWNWFGGLEHAALGSAEPGLDNGTLVVGGLDDTGDSGVNVSLGEAGGVAVDTTLDPAVPVESYREFRSRGVVDGETGVDLGLLRSVRTGDPDGFGFRPDFQNLGSESYTFEVYQNGDLVGGVDGATGRAYIPDRDYEYEIKIVIIWTDAGPLIKIIIVGLEDPIIGPEMDEYPGDEIRMIPENVEVVPDAATDLNMVAAGREQFTVDAEALHAMGNPHRRRGGARFEAGNLGTELTVDNVGSSGEDGVAVPLDDAESLAVHVKDLDVAEEEEWLEGYYFGPAGGWPSPPIHYASLTNVGGELEITADFTEQGTDYVHAQVFESGDLVGETAVEAGVVGHVGGEFRDGWCGSDGDGHIDFDFEEDGDPIPHPMVFADGTELEGDRLRLGPAEPTDPVTELTEFGIRTANTDSFRIVDER